MHAREGSKGYSLGQRRLPASRRTSVRKRRGAADFFRLLLLAFQAVAGAKRMLVVAVLPVILLAAMIVAYNLPVLKVTQVDIVGAKAMDAGKARAALRLEGANILTVDANVIEKLLRQHPAVKGVTVKRLWPSKVVVQVEERRPFVFWQTPEGAFAVDEEGYVLSDAPAPGPLPAISAQEGGVRVGGRVPQGIPGLSKELLDRMAKETGVQPRQFHYSKALGLSVVTDQGWKAVFGDERDLDFKLTTMEAVLRTARDRKLAFQSIDLRFGERPFLR